MAQLEELFQLDGVTAVGKLDDMGRVFDWKAKGVVDPELIRETSKGLEEMISLFVQGARERPRNWTPWRSMTYSGGDMTAIAAGENLVIVETAKANMWDILKILDVPGFGSNMEGGAGKWEYLLKLLSLDSVKEIVLEQIKSDKSLLERKKNQFEGALAEIGDVEAMLAEAQNGQSLAEKALAEAE